jgi:hypothetical protein
VIHYDGIGNAELRDKYIELALAENGDDDTVIFLRAMQNRPDLVPKQLIKRVIARQKRNKDWSQLARTYESLGDRRNAALHYCRSIAESVQEGNAFSAAYYLKELCETGIAAGLFQEAYREFHSKGDLWWQVRCLQELGWQSELNELLVSNRAAIEKAGDTSLLQYLYAATGEQDKLYEQMKLEAEYSVPD